MNTPKRMDAEVVVVGAGPGGCVLSYLLARSGVKTILVERHIHLDREFRGYFFQPLVLKLFDQMGLLKDILKIPHEKIEYFQFVDRGKILFRVRFDDLEPPYNYGVNLPQPHLLEYFVHAASSFPNFIYLNGMTARKLLKQNDAVHGITARNKDGEIQLYSRLLVGADGRYSTIRKEAGIEQQSEKFPFDMVWFDMPVIEGKQYPLQIQIEDEGMLVTIPKGRNHVQYGWLIRKGTFPELKKQGIEHFCQTLIRIDPDLKKVLPDQLTSFNQCSLLDIQVGMAESWVQAGLLLIGDAAHTASPFSGQGNSLAIQDAVVAHDLIMKALKRYSSGVLPVSSLKPFEDYRRPAVAQIQNLQRMQVRLVGLDQPALIKLRRVLVPMLNKTFLFKRMRDKIAMGVQPIQVNTSYFLS